MALSLNLHCNCRDIKPSNVLIKIEGCEDTLDWTSSSISQMQVKLTDFGLSKQIPEDLSLDDMSTVGTPFYDPPEVEMIWLNL